MERISKGLLATAVSVALGAPVVAHATNGMNLEGYGPIAAGMGGASMAYDNGTAAMMNNPATIGLMGEGNRVDVALGVLGPDVDAKNVHGSASSSLDSFLMPAIGWSRKRGQFTYGVGAFAQGGMGAEYDAGSAVDQSANGIPFSMAPTNGDYSGHEQRSELGVGRLIFPLAYTVSDRLTVGGSIDYVWGGLDILWSMDANNFLGGLDQMYANPNFTPSNNRSHISGTMVDAFLGAMDPGATNNGAGPMTAFYWGNFAFSDSSDFTQETRGDGFAGKLGFVYKVNEKLSVGGAYHAETNMSDFEGDVDMSFNVDFAGAGNQTVPVSGKVKVVDFQWPETYGLGLAYKATDRLMVAADWKRLNWSEVMESFNMVITTDNTPTNGGFANKVLEFEYFQDWDDQDVFQIGAAYDVTDKFTVRAGYNYASNPIPDETVSFLFPATIEKHYTIGAGYKFTELSSVDFSLTYAPEVKVTESSTEDAAFMGGTNATSPTTISHSQTNWQVMYSHRF